VPQTNRSAFVRFWRAIRFVFPVHRAIEIRLRRPLHVISNHQIEFAVFVVIDPGRAGAELFHSGQPGLLRDVAERSISVVAKQPALSVRSNKQIVIAVVVVITDRYADAVHLRIESGPVRNIGERSVMIVVIQLGRCMFLTVPRPIRSIHQENVRPPVVVVIYECHARPNCLRQILFSERSGVVNESNACFRGDVLKRHAGFGALGVCDGPRLNVGKTQKGKGQQE
jgi:hypothetical protein